MKILVVSNNYPTERDPSHGTFVYQLIQQFVKMGHEVTVIRPTYLISKKLFWKKRNYGEELATVYRPKYLSTSSKSFFGFNTYHLGEKFQINAVKKIVKENQVEFDLVYAHFFTNAFIAVAALSQFNKPIYAAIGEYYHIDVRRSYYKPDFYNQTIAKITGYVAVSPQIKEKLLSLGIADNSVVIHPNGVDFNIFYPRDKRAMRLKHGLPLDKKLIIFVGRFVADKGPKKIIEAAADIQNLGLIFVGSGEEELNSGSIVFKDKVAAKFVPELLSAADLFVLPTLHEGSCNAIVEAMACGLPIVSSDIPEIKVQCDPSFSILVDPLDAQAIHVAMKKILNDDQILKTMSTNALKHSKKFDITGRAKKILTFLEEGIS